MKLILIVILSFLSLSLFGQEYDGKYFTISKSGILKSKLDPNVFFTIKDPSRRFISIDGLRVFYLLDADHEFVKGNYLGHSLVKLDIKVGSLQYIAHATEDFLIDREEKYIFTSCPNTKGDTRDLIIIDNLSGKILKVMDPSSLDIDFTSFSVRAGKFENNKLTCYITAFSRQIKKVVIDIADFSIKILYTK